MSEPPCAVGMEHRCHRQDGILRGEPHGIRAAYRQAMQHIRAVRVEHAFRIARRARRVEQGRGRQLVEHRPLVRRVAAIQEVLVTTDIRDAGRRHRGPVDHQDKQPDRGEFGREPFHDGQKGAFEKQHPVCGVVCDVGNLRRDQSWIDRMPDRAQTRDTVFDLEMPVIIPRQRGNPVAWTDAPAPQRIGQFARPARRVVISIPVNRTFGATGNNLGVAMEPVGMLQQRRQQQRLVLHQALHGITPI